MVKVDHVNRSIQAMATHQPVWRGLKLVFIDLDDFSMLVQHLNAVQSYIVRISVVAQQLYLHHAAHRIGLSEKDKCVVM